MKKLFSMKLDITDFTADSDFEKLANLNDLSEKVKTAYIPTYEEIQKRSSLDFATILEHPALGSVPKYACYTPELTELNMAMLIQKMEELPDEIVKVAAHNLTNAARNFKLEIPEELKDYASDSFMKRDIDLTSIDEAKFLEKLASKNKDEEDGVVFALDGKYPIHTKGHFNKAASWFERNHTKLSIDELREFIGNLSDQSDVLGVKLEKTAADFANRTETSFDSKFFDHMQVRKTYIPDDESEILSTFDDLVRRADEIGAEKVAYVLEIMDKEANLDPLYNIKIPDPIRTCWGMIEKEASLDIDGTTVTSSALRAISADDLTTVVGNDVISELHGDSGLDILASLPKPVRSEVLNLL